MLHYENFNNKSKTNFLGILPSRDFLNNQVGLISEIGHH